MKKQLKPVELFLAVGIAATIGACGGPAGEEETMDEGTEPTTEEVAPEEEEDEDDEGGEGGEG